MKQTLYKTYKRARRGWTDAEAVFVDGVGYWVAPVLQDVTVLHTTSFGIGESDPNPRVIELIATPLGFGVRVHGAGFSRHGLVNVYSGPVANARGIYEITVDRYRNDTRPNGWREITRVTHLRDID